MDNLLNAALLATVQRSTEHTETIAPAPSATLATGREITFRPAIGKTGTDEYVVLSRIAVQGIIPTDLSIRVSDLNRRNVLVPLPPNLVVNDIVFVGNDSAGITITVQNRRQASVSVTFYVATITDALFERLFGVPGPRGWR